MQGNSVRTATGAQAVVRSNKTMVDQTDYGNHLQLYEDLKVLILTKSQGQHFLSSYFKMNVGFL